MQQIFVKYIDFAESYYYGSLRLKETKNFLDKIYNNNKKVASVKSSSYELKKIVLFISTVYTVQ